MTTATATRPMPWDVMGHALKPTNRTDLAKALADAGMDYTVETWDMQAIATNALGEPYATLKAPKARAVVRPIDGVNTVVGMTGRRFTPIQNPDAFAIADALVKGGAIIDGLADFRHGGASMLALDLNRDVTLRGPQGDDPLTLQLLVKNAHDGSSALTFALTHFRTPCTNALQANIKGAERAWKVSHTPNAAERVELARVAILNAVSYQERFTAVAQRMLDTEMVEAEFAKIVANIWKVDPDATGKVAERKRGIQDDLMHLYRTSDTMDAIRGTRWGGYNALTEYLDHYRPVKGDPTVARAEGALEGPNVRVKDRMWSMFATV